MKYRRLAWLGALAAICATAAGSITGTQYAQAAEKEWKMHLVFVPSRPEAQSVVHFVDLVNEKAADELSIKLYSGGSLGLKDADMLRILPRGAAVQATALYPGYLSRDRPEYADTLPPAVITDHEVGVSLNPILEDIYRKTYDEVGIELLSLLGHGTRDLYIICKDPVSNLEQLRTKKLRVWEQSLVDMFAKVGVSAQIIGQNDLYMALQTGVVDCTIYPVGLAPTLSLQEVAPYASYIGPYMLQPITLIVSREAFNQLSEKTQKIVRDAAKQVEKESFDTFLSGKYDVEGQKVYEAGGGKVIDAFPDADRNAIVEAARAGWAERIKSASATAQQNYEAVNKHMTDSAAAK
ncbi:MAG: TRAP transporter substrate-binding protein DctP [Rhizobiaceae bacterium]|nr:TRAP transporter substrate-binding protein DctP [Rhizobiaceae bacterium]